MEKMNFSEDNILLHRILIVGALVVAAALKFWLVVIDVVPFNSDEAVVALMARHILEGARPIFFYGQAYMGSLDAWLVALGFAIFGQQVWVIRLVQGLLYLGVLLTTVRVGQLALGSKRAGIIAAWLLAVPNVIFTLYTTVSLGGYVEALLLGNGILILGLRMARQMKEGQPVGFWRPVVWGFLVGLGVWVFGMTLVFSIPMGIFLLARVFQWKPEAPAGLSSNRWVFLGLAALGGGLGAVPWWIFAIQNGLDQLLNELAGSAVAVEQGHWLLIVGRHMANLILFGGTAVAGMRPSWEIRWLALPLVPIALTFWMGVVVFIAVRFQKGKTNRFGAGVLVGTMLVLALGFVFTSFGVDPSGRYFLPLAIPLALFAGEMVIYLAERYGPWFWGLAAIILVFHFWGIWQSASRYPPGITTQFNEITQVDHRYMDELIDFLLENDETRGYTNYWVSYPLAFLSGEKLIFVPRLPYHDDFRYTPRDDRYEPYGEIVAEASEVAYITTHHPDLNQALRQAFESRGISWREAEIGDYFVFYDLSSVVRPAELDLTAP